MKYDVDITRIGCACLTFTVEAENEEEAKEKAREEAFNTSWSECSVDYEVDDCRESEEEDE